MCNFSQLSLVAYECSPYLADSRNLVSNRDWCKQNLVMQSSFYLLGDIAGVDCTDMKLRLGLILS